MNTTTPGPICHGHPAPTFHGLAPSVPAHTWEANVDGACQRCPEPVRVGDLYVCHDDPAGIAHVTCPNLADYLVDLDHHERKGG